MSTEHITWTSDHILIPIPQLHNIHPLLWVTTKNHFHTHFPDYFCYYRKRNLIRREEKSTKEDKASSQRNKKLTTKSYVVLEFIEEKVSFQERRRKSEKDERE